MKITLLSTDKIEMSTADSREAALKKEIAELRQEREALRTMLGFYATKRNYWEDWNGKQSLSLNKIFLDRGSRARQVLFEQFPEPEKKA